MSLRDRRKRHDSYYKRAKQESYAARSVFKLEEIDARLGLLRPGARVLDLGCRPGSWLQLAAQRIGAPGRGALVGIDRAPLDVVVPGARVLVGDAFETPPAALLGELDAFDVVLSDMAPDTTGVRSVDQARSEALFEHALAVAIATLAPGGSFLGKLFQGPDFQRLVAAVRARFEQVKVLRPKGTRAESMELYVAGLRRRSPGSD